MVLDSHWLACFSGVTQFPPLGRTRRNRAPVSPKIVVALLAAIFANFGSAWRRTFMTARCLYCLAWRGCKSFISRAAGSRSKE